MRWPRWIVELGQRHPFLYVGGGIGLTIAAIGFAITGWEWIHTHGHPTEHATVISSDETGGSSYCGRTGSRPNVRLTWRSEDPPPGLPSTFTQDTACDATDVGETDEVVRVRHDDGTVSVYVEPATSLVDVAGTTVLGFVGGMALAGVIWLFWKAYYLLRRPKHRR